MIMRPALRKLALTLHIVSSVGMLGAVTGFLALALVGLAANASGIYFAMGQLTWLVILPLAFVTLLIGLLESLGTKWGLLRHYWVVAKLALTLLAVVVLLLQLDTIDLLSTATSLQDLWAARLSLVLHSAGGLVVLLLAVVLSVYKPRGRLPRRVAPAS
jgi:hypothetical protein